MKIPSADSLIQACFAQKMQEQFRAATEWVTSPDKTAALLARQGNKEVAYPYIFLVEQTQTPNTDSYNSRRLSRYGVPVVISDDMKQAMYGRLIPQNFEFEATFVTNDYEAVKQFSRRWAFSRRNGYLQFGVQYGLTSLDISVILSDSVSIPMRENPADVESIYQVISTGTIKGYISEPELGKRQRILQVEAGIYTAPNWENAQFFPFPNADQQ